MTNPKCIIIAPEFDEATQFSYEWSRRLKQEIEKAGWEVVDKSGRRVGRLEVENVLKDNPNVPYIHYDHGSEDAHWGSETETVIDLKNVDLVSGRIVYCMNCLSARKLGVEAWKRGCVYVGYYEAFAFTTYDEELFGIAANSGFIAYVNGERDWRKIKQLMIEAFNQAIERTDDPWSKMLLHRDRDSLRIYNGEQPKPGCLFRRLAVQLFGQLGWNVCGCHCFGDGDGG